MNKYVLMLAAAGLIAAAPAYYAFQAQADEMAAEAPAAAAPAEGEAAAVDCTKLPEGAEVPAECADAAKAATEAAPAAEATQEHAH